VKIRRGVKIGVSYGFSGVKRLESQYLQGIKF
jgi:predicted transporter